MAELVETLSECPFCGESEGSPLLKVAMNNLLYVHCLRATCPTKGDMEELAPQDKFIRDNLPDYADYKYYDGPQQRDENTLQSTKSRVRINKLKDGMILDNELQAIYHLIQKRKIGDSYDAFIGTKMEDEWPHKEAFIEQYHQHYHHNDMQVFYNKKGFFVHYLLRGLGSKGIVSIKRRAFIVRGDEIVQRTEISKSGKKVNWKRESLMDESFSGCFRCLGADNVDNTDDDVLIFEGEMDACITPNTIGAWNCDKMLETAMQIRGYLLDKTGHNTTFQVVPDGDNYDKCELEFSNNLAQHDYKLYDLRPFADKDNFDMMDFVNKYGHTDFTITADEYNAVQVEVLENDTMIDEILDKKISSNADINHLLFKANANGGKDEPPKEPKKVIKKATITDYSGEEVYNRIMDGKTFNKKLYDKALELKAKGEMEDRWLFDIASKCLCDKEKITKRDMFYAVRINLKGAMEFTINKDERRGYEECVF